MLSTARDGRATGSEGSPERARLLAVLREALLTGGPSDAVRAVARPVVAESWWRSLVARIDPEHACPPRVLDREQVLDRREAHPLAAALPLLRHALVDATDEVMHMMIVTDADGHLLWCEGQADVLARAEPVGLTEGTCWTEEAIGTNAMGTALAAGCPVQIHATEHLVQTYHCWTCAASPIRDPDTGAVLGVVDVTGPVRSFHPGTIALVSAAAKLAENQLRLQLMQRDQLLLRRHARHLSGAGRGIVTPSGRVVGADLAPDPLLPCRIEQPAPGLRITLADDTVAVLEPLDEGYLITVGSRVPQPPGLSLTCLGTQRPLAKLGDRQLTLGLRHAEMLVLLALHPDGLSAERLATEVYGDHGNSITARVEMHRLRVRLGPDVLRAQPYRLHARLDADFLAVRAALREGRIGDAVRVHRGPLLPRSESPGVREERESLQATVRRAVIDSTDIDVQWEFADTPHGADDAELAARLRHGLPRGDPRRAVLFARTERWDTVAAPVGRRARGRTPRPARSGSCHPLTELTERA